MAALGNLAQHTLTLDGLHLSFTKVHYNATGDTFEAPAVPESAAALVASGNTAPTVSVASGDNTVTLTSGTTGVDVWVVTRNAGSIGGVNSAGVGGS